MSLPVLWYFADPMCSWCWGFSPVITAIKTDYESRLDVALILGGLRPNESQAMTAAMRDDILHHWHEVEKLSGQQFGFDNAMPEGFIYNTEPASRAVISMANLQPGITMDYFKNIQSAFYQDNVDVTQKNVLYQLAQKTGFNDKERFDHAFESQDIKDKTQLHFQRSREFGVSGFPTVILQNQLGDHILTRGYCHYDELRNKLDPLLD